MIPMAKTNSTVIIVIVVILIRSGVLGHRISIGLYMFESSL